MCAGIVDGSPCNCLCRDCGHAESFHPLPEPATNDAVTKGTVSAVLERVRNESKASLEEARKEANAGFRQKDESDVDDNQYLRLGRGGQTKYTKKSKRGKKMTDDDDVRIAAISLILPQYDDMSDGGITQDAWELPGINTYQQLIDVGLAIVDTSASKKGALNYRASWSSNKINTYLETLFPGPFEWMKNNCRFDGPDEYCWKLLVKERLRLRVFDKRGQITGEDLTTCKGSRGRGWKDHRLFFGLKFVIPEDVLKTGDWSAASTSSRSPTKNLDGTRRSTLRSVATSDENEQAGDNILVKKFVHSSLGNVQKGDDWSLQTTEEPRSDFGSKREDEENLPAPQKLQSTPSRDKTGNRAKLSEAPAKIKTVYGSRKSGMKGKGKAKMIDVKMDPAETYIVLNDLQARTSDLQDTLQAGIATVETNEKVDTITEENNVESKEENKTTTSKSKMLDSLFAMGIDSESDTDEATPPSLPARLTSNLLEEHSRGSGSSLAPAISSASSDVSWAWIDDLDDVSSGQEFEASNPVTLIENNTNIATSSTGASTATSNSTPLLGALPTISSSSLTVTAMGDSSTPQPTTTFDTNTGSASATNDVSYSGSQLLFNTLSSLPTNNFLPAGMPFGDSLTVLGKRSISNTSSPFETGFRDPGNPSVNPWEMKRRRRV